MEITNDIIYIGVNDYKIDLFEGQYKVPNGMSYNSYLILDDKIAVMDTVDRNFTDEWLNNLDINLHGRKPDYLVIHHMEPDHSANILNFMEKYPNTIVVSSLKSFQMMKSFFKTEFENNRIVVNEGSTLNLGKHSLTFISAPMVHWPEVIVTYDETDKILFSADAFGKFGALDKDDLWIDEARRYYIGIASKYGLQVQNLLKKLSNYNINIIAPLHGPVLKDNLNYYLNLYNTWSSYTNETEGIVIFYTSVYGNTKKAIELLAEKLKQKGCQDVKIYDLARCDMSLAISEAFRYNKLVLATTTYNADIFPFMKEFIHNLLERGIKNKTIALIENGSWAPMANKIMKNMLEESKNITWIDNNVKIVSSLNDESINQINNLVDELCS